jgi:photosystem II stability/assembly factor-like uncharacterized protein
MNKPILLTTSCLFVAVFAYVFSTVSESQSKASSEGMMYPQLRQAWEQRLLQDPATGLIPVTRAQELAFASKLPVLDTQVGRGDYYEFTARGPFNFGGRTRGAGIDIANDSILIAGSISGHIYKSTNQGASWEKKTNNDQTWGITCLVQDTRIGKTETWYAGSGEDYNSASQGTAARYIGNGILKTTDNGESWFSLESTQNGTPQTSDLWDRIWRIALDPSSEDDVVLAALSGSIMRSEDGGSTWIKTLGGTGVGAYYSDIAVTSEGVFYAALSSDGAVAGIYRSPDGLNWTNITSTSFPNQYRRTVMGINPSNESEVYFMAETPNSGKRFENFRGDVEWVSFWKYTYVSGDGNGNGGTWEDRSVNLPRGPFRFDDLNLQGGYNMLVAVHPTDENTLIIGGTNLFRSTSAFADSTSTTFIGGYDETTDLPDFQIYENHHPDQHKVFFSPTNPDIMFSANDGGVQRTSDITATPVIWESLNNGYNTTQFYSVALDHGTPGSNELMGGLQDNGTFYTNSNDPFQWKFPWSYDGAFTAIADGGGMHLTSIQLGRMFKIQLDANGNRTGWKRFDPIGGSNYYFIHPWAMDPTDNGIVYLPLRNRLWTNDMVDELPIDNGIDSISTGWRQSSFTLNGSGSAVGVSTNNPSHRVYVGTSSGTCFKVDNAHTATPTFSNVSNFLNASGNINCIAVDPENGDHAMAIFSNYNVHSIHFTEDGGSTWFRAGGNLESESAPEGFPGELYNIGPAPSIRWARILNVEGGKVYFVGTSVGLFATRHLARGTDRESDSTYWVQVAKEEIGNSVVMMLDSREADDLLAVATHGSGMYTARIPTNWNITSNHDASVEGIKDALIYPNPTTDRLTVQSENFSDGIINLKISDVKGRLVLIQRIGYLKNRAINIDVSELEPGIYMLELQQNEMRISNKILIN